MSEIGPSLFSELVSYKQEQGFVWRVISSRDGLTSYQSYVISPLVFHTSINIFVDKIFILNKNDDTPPHLDELRHVVRTVLKTEMHIYEDYRN